MTMLTNIARLPAALVIAAVLCAGVASAADRRLAAFTVLNDAGNPVESPDLAEGGGWLLIYTRVACGSCDQVLDLWTADDPVMWTGRIRIVVGGAAPEGVAAFRQRFPSLAGASWYADTDGSAARALGLSGAPAVFGLTDQTIAWTSQGLLPITRTLIMGWMNR